MFLLSRFFLLFVNCKTLKDKKPEASNGKNFFKFLIDIRVYMYFILNIDYFLI